MVAQFLGLKLRLLANTFKRSPWQLVGMVIALVYGLGLAILVTIGLVALRGTTVDIAGSVVTVFGTLVVLGFILLPLAFGVDDTVDPRRFALFGIPTARLAFGLAIAALVSVPSLIIVIFAFAQIATWARGPLPLLVSVIGAVIIVVMCVLAARVSSALASFLLASRRARDAAGILLIVLFTAAAPAIALLSTVDWESSGIPIMRRIASVAAWTPFGAVWSAPADAANGAMGEAALKLGISAVFVLALWVAWHVLLSVMLVTPPREAAAKTYSGLGWFDHMPATSAGAVAARSLTYWNRDARYRVSLIVIPIVPIVMVVALIVGGLPASVIAWVPVPVMCLFLGWTIHNDVAYDSSAFWTHVASNTSGVADRWGRVIPALLIGLPVAILGSVLTAGIIGDWSILPGLVGLSLAVLLVGLGISSVISAAFPYPAVHPGDSPFAQPQSTGAAGAVVQSLSFFATVLAAVPVLLLVLLGATSDPVWYFVALLVGVVIGIAALVGGVHAGGRIVSRRAPELLAFTLQN